MTEAGSIRLLPDCCGQHQSSCSCLLLCCAHPVRRCKCSVAKDGAKRQSALNQTRCENDVIGTNQTAHSLPCAFNFRTAVARLSQRSSVSPVKTASTSQKASSNWQAITRLRNTGKVCAGQRAWDALYRPWRPFSAFHAENWLIDSVIQKASGKSSQIN